MKTIRYTILGLMMGPLESLPQVVPPSRPAIPTQTLPVVLHHQRRFARRLSQQGHGHSRHLTSGWTRLFSDEAFKSNLKSKVQLTDDQLAQLQKISSEEVARLRQSNIEEKSPEEQSSQAEQSREHAAEAIRGIIGEQKAEDLFALARDYWVKGNEGSKPARPIRTLRPIQPKRRRIHSCQGLMRCRKTRALSSTFPLSAWMYSSKARS